MATVRRLFSPERLRALTPATEWQPGDAPADAPAEGEESWLSHGLRAARDTQAALNPNTYLFRDLPAAAGRILMDPGAHNLARRAVHSGAEFLEGLPGVPESVSGFAGRLRGMVGEPEIPPEPEPGTPTATEQQKFQAAIQAMAAENAEKYGTPDEIRDRYAVPPAGAPSGRHPAWVGGPRAAAIMREAGESGAAESAFEPSPEWGGGRVPTALQSAIDAYAREGIRNRYAPTGPPPMQRAIEGEALEAEHDALADQGQNLWAQFGDDGMMTREGSFYVDPRGGDTIRNVPGGGRRPRSLSDEAASQAQAREVLGELDQALRQYESEREVIEEERAKLRAQEGGYTGDAATLLDQQMKDLERRQAQTQQFYDRMLASLGVDVDAFYRQRETDPVEAAIAGMLAAGG